MCEQDCDSTIVCLDAVFISSSAERTTVDFNVLAHFWLNHAYSWPPQAGGCGSGAGCGGDGVGLAGCWGGGLAAGELGVVGVGVGVGWLAAGELGGVAVGVG